MSVKKIALVLLCMLCIAAPSYAKIAYTIAPELGVMGGTTEYELDIQLNVADSATGTPVKWRLTSLLEYPLDITFAGISGEIRPYDNPTAWSLQLKYLTNINDPGGKMIDTDWEEYSIDFPYTKWSETNSDTKIDMTVLDAEFRFLVAQKKNYDISVFAGGKYQKVYYDIVGLDGWQRPKDDVTNTYGDPFNFSVYQNEIVGTYEIKVKQFKVGFLSDFYLSDNFTSQIKLGFTPLSFDNIDDHVLRFKLSTASGNGTGYLAGFNMRYKFAKSFIQISTSYNKYSANGAQMQSWYGNDPSSPDDDTGKSIEGIPHTIRSTQYSLSIQVGFEF